MVHAHLVLHCGQRGGRHYVEVSGVGHATIVQCCVKVGVVRLELHALEVGDLCDRGVQEEAAAVEETHAVCSGLRHVALRDLIDAELLGGDQ